MPDPVLHLLAGPNGAGKSTLFQRVIGPVTHLPFVNADELAARHWPAAPEAHAYEASQLAAATRQALLDDRCSFVTETVFSHRSKLTLVEDAVAAGYLVHLHIVIIPVSLAVARVAHRAGRGGHTVPENKVRERYERLWAIVVPAVAIADRTTVYDNSRAATPLRVVAEFFNGTVLGTADWPVWTPAELRALTA
jgi:predicted ABC-type ATPase